MEHSAADGSQAEERSFFLDEHDLNIAFNTAALLLGKEIPVEARFKELAGLKSSAKLEDGRVFAKASSGFRSATQEVLVGLALGLLSSLFRRKIGEKDAHFLQEYKQFVGRESALRLHDALRERRGRKGELKPQGNFFDLTENLNKITTLYPECLREGRAPEITWSQEQSRRVLAWYDSAFCKIVVNKKLDRRGVPDYVIDYLVYHELLHHKHPTTFHGESLRRCVHSREFKQDEKKFYHYDLAKEWLGE